MFPFYQFTARMVPWQLRELAQRPGGPVAKVIRGAEKLKGDRYVPEHLQGTLAIETGRSGDATEFLTATDLPHELISDLVKVKMPDTMSFKGFLDAATDTVTQTAKAVASQGRSDFTKAAGLVADVDWYSGRDLPAVQGSLSKMVSPWTDRQFPQNKIIDAIIGSSVPRAATTAGKLSELAANLYEGGEGTTGKALMTALNLMTGAKTTKVRDTQRFYDIRKALEERMGKIPEMREVSRPYLPRGKDPSAVFSPGEQRLYEYMRRHNITPPPVGRR
jgi:hypothetical protein